MPPRHRQDAARYHRNGAFSDKTMRLGALSLAAAGTGFPVMAALPEDLFRGHEEPFAAVSTVSSLIVGSARPAAFAAAVLVMGMAFAADASHVATAQGRLQAEYTASLSGIPIGRGNWVIEISEDQFTAAASGGTVGILRFFSPGHGTTSSQGTVSGGQPVPTNYVSNITTDKKFDDVQMVFAGGSVKDFAVDPPVGPHPDRIPVTDADRRNVFDPMTAVLDLVGGSGDPLSPQACARNVSVFDGRMRYDVRSEFKRMEVVKAEKGYQGPVVVCAVYFVPISGYVPERYAIKYLAAMRDAEVWLAPIAGTRVVVPYRFSLPTPVGTGVLQATQFITVAKPPRAAANVKME
jgi:Protein of unknown function (DUF3108)